MEISQLAEANPWNVPTFWINYASRAIMRHFEERLRPLGFGVAYLPVVVALDQHGALSQKDLLRYARVEQPTMAALLRRMERDQLISRTPDPRDARSRQVNLTDRARQLLTQVKSEMDAVLTEAMADIDEVDQRALMRTLRTVVGNLGEEINSAAHDYSEGEGRSSVAKDPASAE
jgi:DNA-binding MarR family transcriptional regulator